MNLAHGYEASQALIRGLYVSRVRVEDAFTCVYDMIMPAHQNYSTWKYALREDPPADAGSRAVGLAFLASVVLGLLTTRWLLAYSGSPCVARAGGILFGAGLVLGPALHDLACYFAKSNRRRGVAWNFFSEQGRRRPWLKILNATSPYTHFCACLILFLSLLYIAR